jgi:hypothetical protein
MPDIVRTPTQDPLSEKFYTKSPYSFLNNNPIYFIDPDGMLTNPFERLWREVKRDVMSDVRGLSRNMRNAVDKGVAWLKNGDKSNGGGYHFESSLESNNTDYQQMRKSSDVKSVDVTGAMALTVMTNKAAKGDGMTDAVKIVKSTIKEVKSVTEEIKAGLNEVEIVKSGHELKADTTFTVTTKIDSQNNQTDFVHGSEKADKILKERPNSEKNIYSIKKHDTQ